MIANLLLSDDEIAISIRRLLADRDA